MLGLLSAGVSIVMLVLVGRVVALAGPGFEERVGMSYTMYALTGVLVHGFGTAALGAFRRVVRREQLQGTFEQLLASGRDPLVVVTVAGGVELALQTAGYAGLALGAAVVVGVIGPPPPLALAAAALYALAMAGLGLASAGVIVVSKEGEPIAWAFGILSGALGGVCFPQFLLPRWLAATARALPTTHALEIVRAALNGAEPASGSFTMLIAFALSAVALGVLTLRWGLSHARRAGTLSRY